MRRPVRNTSAAPGARVGAFAVLSDGLRLVREPGRARSAVAKAARAFQQGGPQSVADLLRDRGWAPASYARWYQRFQEPGPSGTAVLRARARALSRRPLVSVILSGSGDEKASVSSVAAQIYPAWKICAESEDATGEIAVPLAAGDVLVPWALLAFVEALEMEPDAAVAYGDYDRDDVPSFKPDWDPELLSWPGYLGRAAAFRLHGARGLTRPASGIGRARHVPHILCHGRAADGTAPVAPAGDAVPRVSVIVPTRDGGETLRRCVESLGSPTSYPDLELILVDNQSRDPVTLSLLGGWQSAAKAKILRYDAPFNYSAVNNLGARAASGTVLLLLNDDVEALASGWLHEMVRHALRPGVGPVGAKLLYPDGTIQHAGVVTGMFGVAGHLHRGCRDPVWMGEYPRTVSAVTGAALAIRRDLYDELGGLDESLAVAFNDVDLCLRAENAGYRTVYTPHAVLLHKESWSRGADDTAEKRARFDRETAILVDRWGPRLCSDPYFTPNMSLHSHAARLAWPPRVPRLWER